MNIIERSQWISGMENRLWGLVEVLCNWLSQSFIWRLRLWACQAWPRAVSHIRVALSPGGRSLLWQTAAENWRGPASSFKKKKKTGWQGGDSFPKRLELIGRCGWNNICRGTTCFFLLLSRWVKHFIEWYEWKCVLGFGWVVSRVMW